MEPPRLQTPSLLANMFGAVIGAIVIGLVCNILFDPSLYILILACMAWGWVWGSYLVKREQDRYAKALDEYRRIYE